MIGAQNYCQYYATFRISDIYLGTWSMHTLGEASPPTHKHCRMKCARWFLSICPMALIPVELCLSGCYSWSAVVFNVNVGEVILNVNNE
jgi:predicted anti-sigma-YlaC factor YlaD